MNTLSQKISRRLSYLLRHNPEDLKMDKNGYVNVLDISKKLDISLEDIKKIVFENDKKRFRFSDNGIMIRASQGHTIDIDTQPKETKPPKVLFHGTATKSLDSIYKTGINKGQRNHLHLSDNKETATSVGSRHGAAFILEIDSEKMYEDGYKFYLSDNKVWLTESVPRIYIK
jgi:putative RNA 2'-phosphotransferase